MSKEYIRKSIYVERVSQTKRCLSKQSVFQNASIGLGPITRKLWIDG